MKNDLTLNIGTKFDGDGLKKLDATTKKAAQGAKSAAQAMGSISAELGKVGGAAGKAAQAASGLMSVFAAGGPIGITIAAITTGVGLLVKAFNDAKERAKEAAAAITKSFEAAFDASSKRMSAIIERMTASISASDKIKEKLSDYDSKQLRQSINSIQERALAERARTQDESERSRIDAREQRDIGVQQAENEFLASINEIIKYKETAESIAQANNELREEIENYAKELDKQRKRIERAGVAEEYERLSKAAEEAREVVLDKGDDAVVGTATRYLGNSYGAVQSYDVNITAKDAQESADAALKKYAEENEDAIKDLLSFLKSQEELRKKYELLEDNEKKYNEALEKHRNASELATIAMRERDTKIKQLNEKFDEQMKAIDKSLAAEAEAEKKKIEAEKKRIEAEEKELRAAVDKARLEQEEADRQRGLENLQIMRERILDAEKMTAVLRLEQHKKEQQAAKELAEAEKKAADILNLWKANPQQNFNDWNQAQKEAARQAEKDAKQQAKNVQQAQDNANIAAGRIFDRNGNIRKSANNFDIGRFAEQADYLGFKNVDENLLSALQDKHYLLSRKLLNDDGTLKRGVNENSADVKLFKQLDGSLKKLDQVREAEKKRKEAEEREKKRAENEDKRTKALEEIDKQMKILNKKMEL